MNYLIFILVILLLLFYCGINYIKNKLRYNNIHKNKLTLENKYYKYKINNDKKQIKYINYPNEFILMNNLINEFNNNSDKWINLIQIGDIYTKGIYPIYKPNKYLGLKCFKIAMLSPNIEISNLANIKYLENKYNKIDNLDILGNEIPIEYGNKIYNIAKYYLDNTSKKYTNNNQNNNQNNILYEIDLTENNNLTENNEEIIIDITENNNDYYLNDLQNVHDHSVNNIIKTNIDLLKKNYNIENINNEDIINQMIEKIYEYNDIDDEIKLNAIEVLNSLDHNIHITFQISEIDSLKYIYKYIKNNSNKDNLYHILISELSNCIENGFIICSTGKISRIISILDGLDTNYNQIKNIYAIKEEIQVLANKIREEILNNANELDKKNYIENIDDKLSKLMIIELEKKIDEIYYKSLNLNKDILQSIVNDIIIGF